MLRGEKRVKNDLLSSVELQSSVKIALCGARCSAARCGDPEMRRM